jgi:rod shape-determining protein MreD
MVKSLIINSLIIAAVVMVQSTILHFVSFYGVIPDLLMIFLLFISLKGGSIRGEVVGFIGGLLIDILSLSPLGFHSLIYAVIGFSAGLTNKNVSTESLLTQVLFILLGLGAKYLLSSFIIILFSIETTSFALMGKNFFIELLFTIVLTPIIFSIANKIYAVSHKKRVGL